MRIGDYVRTKQKGLQSPQIAKIKSMKRDAGYNNQYYIELDHNLLPDYNLYIYEEDIAKTSPRIIDLIEVGDYVNGMIVHCVYADNDEIVVGGLDCLITDTLVTLRSNHIKSIVTKESFENISYKVGE